MGYDHRKFENTGDEFHDSEYPDEFDDGDDDLSTCPNCGGEIYDDSPKCPKCGQWLDTDGEDPAAGDSALWVVLLIFVLFVGMAVAISYLMTR